MTPRMHCVALGCTQGVDSCERRHKAARRVEVSGRTGWKNPEFEETRKCAECGTGAIASGLVRLSLRTPTFKPALPAHGAHLYTYKGEEKTVRQLSEVCGVPARDIYQRHVKYGWTIEAAVETDVRRQVIVR